MYLMSYHCVACGEEWTEVHSQEELDKSWRALCRCGLSDIIPVVGEKLIVDKV